MKLYTEEQIREAHQNGKNGGNNENWYETDEYVNSLTPIELPSDKEIDDKIVEDLSGFTAECDGAYEYSCAFEYGAKWVIEQIKQQDNG